MALHMDKVGPTGDRRSARVEVGFYAELRGSSGELHRCFVTSLSSRGLYAETLCGSEDFPDSKCWLDLRMPDRPHPLPVVGEVLRTEGGMVYRGRLALLPCLYSDWDSGNLLTSKMILDRGRVVSRYLP